MDAKILYKSLYHGERQCGFFEPKMYYCSLSLQGEEMGFGEKIGKTESYMQGFVFWVFLQSIRKYRLEILGEN